jgi:hypothetical protein
MLLYRSKLLLWSLYVTFQWLKARKQIIGTRCITWGGHKTISNLPVENFFHNVNGSLHFVLPFSVYFSSLLHCVMSKINQCEINRYSRSLYIIHNAWRCINMITLECCTWKKTGFINKANRVWKWRPIITLKPCPWIYVLLHGVESWRLYLMGLE